MVLGFFFQDESNKPKITIQLVWEVLKLELQKQKITTIVATLQGKTLQKEMSNNNH